MPKERAYENHIVGDSRCTVPRSLPRSFFSLMAVSTHRRPLRHFVPLPPKGAALRGKGSAPAQRRCAAPLSAPVTVPPPLASLLGELAAIGRLRGRQTRSTAIREKKRQGIEKSCHCETGSQTGCGNPHPLCTANGIHIMPEGSGLPRRSAPRNDRVVLTGRADFDA